MTRDFLIILHSYLYQFVKVHTSASISVTKCNVFKFDPSLPVIVRNPPSTFARQAFALVTLLILCTLFILYALLVLQYLMLSNNYHNS